MKDFRIVIVSWNVERLLERCLKSLPEACDGLDWDVVVVDNASSDESAKKAEGLMSEWANGHVIINPENRGFAKACNQGIDGYNARYVLLLNPDTECPPGSLFHFINAADSTDRRTSDVRHSADVGRPTGILGPRLVETDGKHQPSVRGFPNVWNQMGILLKLHHVLPWFFRKYFNGSEQVMGACFLIRRELLEQIGGLDERYFIWFEEVDFCKQAKARGWEVRYEPSVTVIHHGGQSFAQVMSAKKQAMFNDSLKKYFKKWHPGWRAWLISLVCPAALLETKIIGIVSSNIVLAWVLGIALFELVSLATVFNPVPRAVATVAVGLTVFMAAIRRPSFALAMLLVELMIGSKGALLKIPNGWEVDGGISLRIVITAAFLLGWLYRRTSDVRRYVRQLSDVRRPTIGGISKPWVALAALCMWGVIRGFWLKNQFLFQDANAWGYLILLLPVLNIARRDSKNLLHYTTQAAIAALLWVPIKTLTLLYVWSHGIKSLSQPLYLWVRRTGVGEVTLVTGNLFRVFIQSQVYAIFALLFAAAYVARSKRVTRNGGPPATGDQQVEDDGGGPRQDPSFWVIPIASAGSLLISLSRSFWVGFICGIACFKLLAWRAKFSFSQFWSVGWRFGAGFFAAVGLIFAVVAFPYPPVDVGSLATLFGSRGSVSDAAAETRWSLLPAVIYKIKQAPILGSGFGATITYHSKDPRILAKNPYGLYTTYAFEWGWLEHWIKFGILGIPVMLWLLCSIVRRAWRSDGPWWVRTGFVASIVSLGALHVFTPYLNHPLGFGLLLAAEGWIVATKRE
ncbi:glycosyltransferase [Candidatus Uhrbacteria bacterium]|nr:glycosyltransferase [Candidatus Uhrbacteria bacterium]